MWEGPKFIISRLRERLWIKPLIVCIISIAAVFLVHLVDQSDFGRLLPAVTQESTETFLKIMASSMLVIATFAVGSMVAAYASASNSATPRSFPLIIADDSSQNALSVFVGAFIYSVVALAALMNGLYDGWDSTFILFAVTIFVFGVVIVTFVWWVDNIARLGRLGYTIDKVEAATAAAIEKRQSAPRLGGTVAYSPPDDCKAVYAESIGYIQRVNMNALQARAAESKFKVLVAALPGTFCTPNRPVAWVVSQPSGQVSEEDLEAIAKAFVIGGSRVFDQDPRYGLVVLSEISSRALSPAVNDPGTAIDVTHTLFGLLSMWHECGKKDCEGGPEVEFDRVAVPELSLADMFDDAFSAVARDGAGTIEVIVRLLKILEALAAIDDPAMRNVALKHARLALARAEYALTLPQDLETARETAAFVR